MNRPIHASFVLTACVLLAACGEKTTQTPQSGAARAPDAQPPAQPVAVQPARIPGSSVTDFDPERRKNGTWTGLGCALNTPDDAAEIAVARNEDRVFEGYFMGKDKDDPGDFVFVLLGEGRGYGIPVSTNLPRPDVAEYFKSPAADQTGYLFSASLASVEPGTYAVDFFYVRDGIDYFCESGKKIVLK